VVVEGTNVPEQVHAESKPTISTTRRGRPSKVDVNARKAAEEQRVDAEIEAAARCAKEEEEAADRKAGNKTRGTTVPQANFVFDGGMFLQGGSVGTHLNTLAVGTAKGKSREEGRTNRG
jgi:hypothetical protein